MFGVFVLHIHGCAELAGSITVEKNFGYATICLQNRQLIWWETCSKMDVSSYPCRGPLIFRNSTVITAQVVETSVTVNDSPIQDCTNLDDHIAPVVCRIIWLLGSNHSLFYQGNCHLKKNICVVLFLTFFILPVVVP